VVECFPGKHEALSSTLSTAWGEREKGRERRNKSPKNKVTRVAVK
jgi:hypothetical protein